MTAPTNRGSPIRRVLETALYFDDLAPARAFYVDLLGLAPLLDMPRLLAVDAGHGTVLLLFRRGETAPLEMPGGLVPGHGAEGVQHVAFAVDTDALTGIRERLMTAGLEVESRVRWTLGGESLYCRDPGGHSVEFATPGTWPTY